MFAGELGPSSQATTVKAPATTTPVSDARINYSVPAFMRRVYGEGIGTPPEAMIALF